MLSRNRIGSWVVVIIVTTARFITSAALLRLGGQASPVAATQHTNTTDALDRRRL
jgi:hypothetical protein